MSARAFKSIGAPRPKQTPVKRQFRVVRYDETGVTDVGLYDSHSDAADSLQAEIATKVEGKGMSLELLAVVSRVIVAEDGRLTMERAT